MPLMSAGTVVTSKLLCRFPSPPAADRFLDRPGARFRLCRGSNARSRRGHGNRIHGPQGRIKASPPVSFGQTRPGDVRAKNTVAIVPRRISRASISSRPIHGASHGFSHPPPVECASYTVCSHRITNLAVTPEESGVHGMRIGITCYPTYGGSGVVATGTWAGTGPARA